jgi:hypothetical protein
LQIKINCVSFALKLKDYLKIKKQKIMEEKITEKKVWESPEVEIINSKMTNGGSHSWHVEGGSYYDNYTS